MAKRPKPVLRANQFPTAKRRNEDLIRDAIEQFHLTENSEVFDLVLNDPQNFEAIEDNAKREASYKDAHLTEPTNDARADRCIEWAGDGSTIRKLDWARCVKDGKLVDQARYHALIKTRLMEQIRKCRGQVERAWLVAQNQQEIAEKTGEGGAVDWRNIEPDPLPRIPTGIKRMDQIFGVTREFVDDNGDTVPEQWGMVRGFVYALGAKRGVGKTRLMVRLLSNICGCETTGWDGSPVGGLKALYFQAETSRSQFVSIFIDGVWDDCVDVKISGDTLLQKHFELIEENKPDVVVIDAKDMLHEFSRHNLFKRALRQYKDMAVQHGFSLVIISHVNKAGELKGSSDLDHLVDAIMLASRSKHDRDLFSIMFDKNRLGEVQREAWFKHTEREIIEWDSGVVKTELSPEMALLIADVDPDNEDAPIAEVGD